MFFNGKVLLEEPFRIRRLTLRAHFPPLIPSLETTTARLDHVESCESTEGRESEEEFFQKAVDDPRSEGLMIKAMAERYVIGSDTCSKVLFKDVQYEFGGLVPSMYFRPSEVWELRGADITLSPRSIAALGFVSDQRGLSIRFPRFIRTREDKRPEDATGPEILAELWKKQAGKPEGGGGADEGDLLDVDPDEETIEDDEYDDVDGDGREVVLSD